MGDRTAKAGSAIYPRPDFAECLRARGGLLRCYAPGGVIGRLLERAGDIRSLSRQLVAGRVEVENILSPAGYKLCDCMPKVRKG